MAANPPQDDPPPPVNGDDAETQGSVASGVSGTIVLANDSSGANGNASQNQSNLNGNEIDGATANLNNKMGGNEGEDAAPAYPPYIRTHLFKTYTYFEDLLRRGITRLTNNDNSGYTNADFYDYQAHKEQYLDRVAASSFNATYHDKDAIAKVAAQAHDVSLDSMATAQFVKELDLARYMKMMLEADIQVYNSLREREHCEACELNLARMRVQVSLKKFREHLDYCHVFSKQSVADYLVKELKVPVEVTVPASLENSPDAALANSQLPAKKRGSTHSIHNKKKLNNEAAFNRIGQELVDSGISQRDRAQQRLHRLQNEAVSFEEKSGLAAANRINNTLQAVNVGSKRKDKEEIDEIEG